MKKKNKEILEDVQKYLKNDLEHPKEKNKTTENKEDNFQNVEETNFEYVVRSEVKAWIKKMLRSLAVLQLKMQLKKSMEKKKNRSQIF